jgi:hypothetical protein
LPCREKERRKGRGVFLMTNKRRLFYLAIGFVIGAWLTFAFARCSHAERLMANTSKNGNVLVMSETEWVDMVKHVMSTGDMEISGTTMYYYKKYYLGTATPPHQTMPYDFFVTMIVIPPWSSQPGVLVSLKYSRNMGDGYRGHVLLYMMDNNFDMVPDEIIRRAVVTRNLRMYISGNGINKDTYMFNSRIPTDQNEWNEWVAWLKTKFQQEGDSNVLEDPDSDSDYRSGDSYR